MADEDRQPAYAAMRYAAVGMEFGTIVALGVIAGYYADQYVGSAPLFTLLLTVGGMYGALRRLL
ncbi:MAG TPA: AtpZ/AtpI family protein, partial [Candidatus Binatia bacterium]|nr:AtpZ/AtpI family protein [Candidatus Binatia bacterium]